MNLKAKLEEVLEPYCATDDACCAAVEAVLQLLGAPVWLWHRAEDDLDEEGIFPVTEHNLTCPTCAPLYAPELTK